MGDLASPGGFAEAVRRIGLGPGWRLHAQEEPTLHFVQFVLYNDATGRSYQMKVTREDLANDNLGVQRALVEWIRESAAADPIDLLAALPDPDCLDDTPGVSADGKTRKIDLED